jgi:hypothetical protein
MTETKLLKPSDIQAIRNKTQLHIDDSSTRVNPTHTHGLGCWGNPRVVFGVRVDNKLKIEFDLAAQALFGSTCNAVESYMCGVVGAYKTQLINGVNPCSTVSIGEIKIERNLRERRKVSPESTAHVHFTNVKAEDVLTCEIGECEAKAVETGVYHVKGKAPVEYRVCAACAAKLAESSAWSFKRCTL